MEHLGDYENEALLDWGGGHSGAQVSALSSTEPAFY